MASPYEGRPVEDWDKITKGLIEQHPLKPQELVKTSLSAWKSIFESGIGSKNFKIGKDILPTPQIMGFLLHELIALELKSLYPTKWKRDREVGEKDLVYVENPLYSVEIKTSSNKSKIFGNRSYGQEGKSSKKDKTGYFLTINFERFSESSSPSIRLIRFGWLDHADWISQKASTGQQARVNPLADKHKLVKIYP